MKLPNPDTYILFYTNKNWYLGAYRSMFFRMWFVSEEGYNFESVDFWQYLPKIKNKK